MKNKKEKTMTNSVLETLCARRSVRAFLPTQLENEKLEAILRAATYAPTGRNRQSPRMVVVQDKKTLDRLEKMNAEIMGTPDAKPFYGAPTAVIVLADRTVPTHFEDGCLVMGNLMNAAFSLGVDSCWIHRARQEFESEEGKALLRAWGIEGDYVGIGHCILGYRAGELPAPSPRKKDYVVFAPASDEE